MANRSNTTIQIIDQRSEFPLPGILGDIERCAGREIAEKVAAALGGRMAYIPSPDSNRRRGCHFFRLVGEEALDAINKAIGWGNVPIPFGPFAPSRQRSRRVDELLCAGVSTNKAAHAAGIGERTAWRRRRALRLAGKLRPQR